MSSSKGRAPLRGYLERTPLAPAIPRAADSGELPAFQPRGPGGGGRGEAAVRRLGHFARLAQRYADAYNRLFRYVSLCMTGEWRSPVAESDLAPVWHRGRGPVRAFRPPDLASVPTIPRLVFGRLTCHSSVSRGSRCLTLALPWATIARQPCRDGATLGSSLLMVAEPTDTP